MREYIANQEEIRIELKDIEWPFEYTDHDRMIVRAIVVDDDGYFYFVRASRDDEFGKAVLIETSGGGVESGEKLEDAIRRELREELGIEADILSKIGVVTDYYNLIHRHNINNYYLCRVSSFGEKHLTKDEIESFHLSTLKLRYEEAVREYENCSKTKLGHLIANRELPILKRAKEIIDSCQGTGLTYITLREHPELKKTAAEWFHSKWGVPEGAYLECMETYLSGETELG